MKTLLLQHDYNEESRKLVGQFPDRSHATQTLNADTKVIAPDGGITALLLCGVIPGTSHRLGFELLKSVNGPVDNRPNAMGTVSLPKRVKLDGTLSRFSGVNARVMEVVEARQGMLGYSDRSCGVTPLTIRHPEMLEGTGGLSSGSMNDTRNICRPFTRSSGLR